jgi:hypothetical protein
MAPALGILLLRRLESPSAPGLGAGAWPRRLAWAATALLALLVTYADHRWANGVRDAAAELCRDYVGEGRITYFAGHWGFQYYMERGGARPIDLRRDTVERGQLVIIPTNNADMPLPPGRAARLVEERLVFARWIATVAPAMAANFYVSKDVLMPFGFGRGAVDGYQVWEARSPLRYFGSSRAVPQREQREQREHRNQRDRREQREQREEGASIGPRLPPGSRSAGEQVRQVCVDEVGGAGQRDEGTHARRKQREQARRDEPV